MTRYLVDGVERPVGRSSVAAGMAGPEETALTGSEDRAVITLQVAAGADSTIHGVTIWLAPDAIVNGFHHVIDRHPNRGWSDVSQAGAVLRRKPRGAVTWSMRPGATAPDKIVPVNTALLELYAAGRQPGAPVSGRFKGLFWEAAGPAPGIAAPAAAGRGRGGLPHPPAPPPLIINEVAARGEPRDWFELYNASGAPLALAGFLLADDLTDRSRRIPFLPDLRIEPGAYLRIELDSDRWPGFALGRGEELGIWTWYGAPVAQVDWQAGDSGRGTSYARVPDLIGPFRTVPEPTPGAPNKAP